MINKFWPLVAGFCLVAYPLPGSDAAPAYLPIGNNLLDWIVTSSPCSVTFILQSTNATGGLNTCGMFAGSISFSSYKDFQSYVVVNGSRLRSYLVSQNASGVRFRVKTTYTGLNPQGIQASCAGLTIDTSLDPTAIIAVNSPYLTPTVQSVVLPVSGVTSASVQFGSGSLAAMPIVGTNGIVWNTSFATNYGRVRVLLTFSDGGKVIYTQGGNPILPPAISIGRYQQYGYSAQSFSPYYLFISGSYGADTAVESTTNFVSWTPFVGMPWDSPVTSTIVPVSASYGPMHFFRAKSY